jgi:hypothetical protein
MAPACAPLAAALANVPLRLPSVPVYSNVTGRPYADVEEIRAGLVAQVVAPVRWQETVEAMIAMGLAPAEKSAAAPAPPVDPAQGAAGIVCYDLGPRDTLKAMLRKTNLAAWKTSVSIDVL